MYGKPQKNVLLTSSWYLHILFLCIPSYFTKSNFIINIYIPGLGAKFSSNILLDSCLRENDLLLTTA